ncbi:MAG TPA: LamG-like jellyroll fold domain-containing protein [Gemmatimonadaceae bacterium]|nr:LamG-like jellyroll fold domain-containing protein [Gemmatimonadaceae bacterium]
MTRRNVSSYLPNLTGPLDLQVGGVDVDVPRRSTINFVGLTVADNPDNERTDITSAGGAGVAPSANTKNTTITTSATELDTSNATPTTIGATFALANESITTVDAQVSCIQAGALKAKIFNIRRHLLNKAGAITASIQADASGPDEIGGAMSASVAINFTGTTGRIDVTGVASTNLRWRLDHQRVQVIAAAPPAGALPAAPTAIAPTSGSSSGGTSVTITVPSSTGLTGAKVGGVPLTSFAIVNATTVSGITGARTVGAADVVVSNATGDSLPLTGAFTYNAPAAFSIASLNLSVYVRNNYAGSPWVGLASAGTSGTPNNLIAGVGGAPPAGTAVNGGIPAAYNGTLYLTGPASGVAWGATTGTTIIVAKPTVAAVNDANTILNPGLFAIEAAGVFQAGYSNAGLRVSVYDGTAAAYKECPAIPAAVNAWHVFAARFDNSTVNASVDGSLWTAAATAANAPPGGGALQVGKNFNTLKFTGDMMMVITSPLALTQAELNSVYASIKADFPAMALP